MKKLILIPVTLLALFIFIVSCSGPFTKSIKNKNISSTRTITSENGLGKVNGLGVYYTESESRFAIWSPDSSNVTLNLNGTDYETSLDGNYTEDNIYSVTIAGDLNLGEYYFKIDNITVRDPYGVMAKSSEDINIVINLDQTAPDGGWVSRPELSEREDAIIYEIHIRDFTLDTTSGISSANRGKYLGMVETGTTYNGYTTGIDHLKELGINTVQIMPYYDFSTTHYNWGYDPRNYNVPEEQYASDGSDYILRIKELKTMINEFHKNGIRVVMDVVYNHSFDFEMFKNISDKYYTDNDLSGCLNSIDTGEDMVRKMIMDSLSYWVEEYNIDGFRFDLMGIFHAEAMKEWGIQLNAAYPERTLLLYGEPWIGGSGYDADEDLKVRLGKMPTLKDAHIGAFNDQFRTALKGSSDGSDGNYIFNSGTGNDISMGSRGAILYTLSTAALENDWDPMFAYDPEQSITYVTAHDNLTLWDKITNVGATGNYAKRVDTMAMGIIFTSQGISFMHGGSEFLRSKVYNDDWTYAHNSYNAPDEYNKIYWNLKEENYDIFTYYKNMIALRNEHPGFRMNTWNEINDNIKTTIVNDKVIITEIDSGQNGDSWDNIIVIYNSGTEYSYTLPEGDWEIVVEDGTANSSETVNGVIVAAGTAITILRGKASSGTDSWTEAYFRGTSNDWESTSMSKNTTTGLWETTQSFGTDDPRFKIAHYTDWTEAYPEEDYSITEGAGSYKITFNDSTKAITVTKKDDITGDDLTIHYREWESSTTYSLHPWDGLTGDVVMTYEGEYDSEHWWEVTIADAPSDFKFCFTNSNGNWDGTNRSYTEQTDEIYIIYGDSSIYTIRP